MCVNSRQDRMHTLRLEINLFANIQSEYMVLWECPQDRMYISHPVPKGMHVYIYTYMYICTVGGLCGGNWEVALPMHASLCRCMHCPIRNNVVNVTSVSSSRVSVFHIILHA